MIIGLDHIGIAVAEIEETLAVYENLLGLSLRKREEMTERKIKIAFLLAGDTNIELIEPTDDESAISKFLEKRGQGIHHLAFKVRNIEEMLEELKEKGVVLIDERPRVGADGAKIAFLHPKSTGSVLIELCEH